MPIKLVSLYAGAGGLDLGFEQAGFAIPWANEYDNKIWETYENNFKDTHLDRRSILDVKNGDIPKLDGIIGGPPCQSWSLAGSMNGVKDPRGQLFYQYLRLLKDINPKFFLAENVPGIMSKTHISEFEKLIVAFEECGYDVFYDLLNAADFGVPQLRKRVIVIGFRKDLGVNFKFPKPTHGHNASKNYVSQKDAFGDLPEPKPAMSKNKANEKLNVPNHEYYTGNFSSRYMSRNRKMPWDEPGYTVEASGRHSKIHPSANDMIKLGTDNWKFDEKSKKPYRRLSVRESARLQTFPDEFVFYYDYLNDGYKMIGNAVPVRLAYNIAKQIQKFI